MGKFWCWLFGHNWNEYVGHGVEKTFVFFCSRCGKTGGNITPWPAAGESEKKA